jgi:hypothetical protein
MAGFGGPYTVNPQCTIIPAQNATNSGTGGSDRRDRRVI